MAKDPAFLFYPNDWIGGTMGMTFEEKGAYMELLMLQFNRGHMTKHMMGQTVGQLLDKVLDKFEIDTNGLYFNSRLEHEKIKRKKFTESRRNNVCGLNQHTKKQQKIGAHMEGHIISHMTSHMENENISIDIVKNNSINYRMFEIFKKINIEYPEDKKLDYTALFAIATKISKSKNILQHEMLNGKMEDVLKTWANIVEFIVSDKWFSTRSLTDINNEWQRLIQSMTNKNKEVVCDNRNKNKNAYI